MKKERARIAILSHLAQFSFARQLGGLPYCGLDDMRFHNAESNPVVGSLCVPKSAPASKWYLSWLVEYKPGDWPVYALESIEDGEVCNWSNIGLIAYNAAQVASHPEWRWTDEQFAFKDRWNRACYKKRDAYIYLPTFPVFDKEGDGVTLGVRVRFGLDERIPTRHFDNWRKVRIADMLAFYDEMSAQLAIKKSA